MIDKKPFTPEEEAIMKKIVEANNLFADLAFSKPGHPSEHSRWVEAIHDLQNILTHRVVKRDYPNYFR